MKIAAETVTLSEVELAEGRSFVTLRCGPINSRRTGKLIVEVTPEHLAEMARVFNARAESDPVVIDWQHASNEQVAPEVSGALGRIIAAEVVGDTLVVTPEYTERGRRIVEEAGGVLWSSPELHIGDVFDRAGGERIGGAQLLAVTLTPRPQQTASTIDAVRLNESNDAPEVAQEVAGMTPEETIAALRDEIAELKAASADLLARLEAAEAGDAEMAEDAEAVVATLTEAHDAKVIALTEQVEALTAKAVATEREAWFSVLLHEGRVSPSMKAAAIAGYDIPALREHFAGGAVIIDLSERGSDKAGDVTTEADALVLLKEEMAKHEGTDHAKLMAVKATNPELIQLAGLEG